MTRVLAAATVDPAGPNRWSVRVWGQPPFDYERVYLIKALVDTKAAQEGIRRFVEGAEQSQV